MNNPITKRTVILAVFSIIGVVAYEKTVGPQVRSMIGGV